MFTGIAYGKFRTTVNCRADGIRELTIDLGDYGNGLQVGASVAINGVCLTAVETWHQTAQFEVGSATARVSNLGQVQHGSYVNIERSFRVGDEIGGHLLSGHVADVATTIRMTTTKSEALLRFAVPQRWRGYLMPKGFVALNGCSLTVAEYDAETGIGATNLIPETLRRTTFGDVKIGDSLNLEVDSQTQTIVNTVRAMLANKDWLLSIS